MIIGVKVEINVSGGEGDIPRQDKTDRVLVGRATEWMKGQYGGCQDHWPTEDLPAPTYVKTMSALCGKLKTATTKRSKRGVARKLHNGTVAELKNYE